MAWSVAVLLVNLGVLALVLHNARRWPRLRTARFELEPSVSVLIPARNEEGNIPRVLDSVLSQTGVAEILIYDDHSTDDTAARVMAAAQRDSRVRLISPEPLPANWCGKTFACWQLAQHARGPWMLFLDADVQLAPNAVSTIVRAAEEYRATFLSCWPGLELHGLAENLFMPLLNFVVFSLFQAPLSLRMKMPSLGLAHGACILADRASYFQIGGPMPWVFEKFFCVGRRDIV